MKINLCSERTHSWFRIFLMIQRNPPPQRRPVLMMTMIGNMSSCMFMLFLEVRMSEHQCYLSVIETVGD